MDAPYYEGLVRSDPGCCWRMVQKPGGPAGQPMSCPEPARWIGWARRRPDAPWVRVWSCDRHVDGVADARSASVVTGRVRWQDRT